MNSVQVTGTLVNAFNTVLTDSGETLASYDDKPNIKIDIMSGTNNPTHLASNDTQNINSNGVANFYVVITNN